MDTALIALAALLVLPLLLLVLLRINAVLVFLATCLGYVLTQFVAPDADLLLSVFGGTEAGVAAPENNTVRIALILLPVVLTAAFMIKSVKKGGRQLLNLFPSLGVSLLLVYIIVPLLPADLSAAIVTTAAWEQITKFEDLVVGISALLCLLAIWAQRPKHVEEKHGKHKR